MKINTITHQANGQWGHIIQSLTGINLTQNKHSPCPVCGGKDRFRFDDKDGRGTYICNQCGAGDGLNLLSRIRGLDILSAANEVASLIGVSDNQMNKGGKPPASHKEHSFLGKLGKAKLGISPYLKAKELLYPALMNGQALLIPLMDINGNVTAIQTITPDGKKIFQKGDKKKGAFYVVISSNKEADHLNFKGMLPGNYLSKAIPENLSHYDIQNLNRGELFIIAEGVATTLTIQLLMPNATCIAAIDSGNLLPVANVIRAEYPHSMIVIAGDNDTHLTKNKGVEAAKKAASAVNGYIAIPSTTEKADWHDWYLEKLHHYEFSDTLEDECPEFSESIKKGREDFLPITTHVRGNDFSDITGGDDAEFSDSVKKECEDLFGVTTHVRENEFLMTQDNEFSYILGDSNTEILNVLKKEFSESIKKENILEVTSLSDGTELSPSEINRLKQMNQIYTQVILPDGGLIYSKRLDGTTGYYTLKYDKMNAFRARFDHEQQIARKNPATAWLKWQGKNYKPDGVGFFPNPALCPPTVLNLFDGFAIEPKQGDCSLYLNHIKNVLCSGDQVAYECFIAWLAHLFQQPEEKPSFAIVMTSEQGAGKGISIKPILQILGCFGAYENGIERITGRFNSTIANKLLAFIDEVYITTHREADALKSLISETKINIEQKGIDPIQTGNYTRFIFASNRLDAIRAGIRERRYLVLNVNNKHAQDKVYFDALGQWIEHNGAACLLHYLLHYDLKNFDSRRAPQTKALNELILSRLTGIDGFIYDQLMSDNPFNILASMGSIGRLAVKDLVALYLEYAKDNNEEITKAKAAREIGDIFNRVFQVNKVGRSGRGTGVMYEIPDIEALRVQFADIRMKMSYEDLF